MYFFVTDNKFLDVKNNRGVTECVNGSIILLYDYVIRLQGSYKS